MENSTKIAARHFVRKALRDGVLVKARRCKGCGRFSIVEAHHESYNKEDWLNITWLCKKCHDKKPGHCNGS
ncbi:MAG: hypothetical protein KAS32_19280 [Candidatus Peribacteraceae bacterium]|nr:hypothetical protein [Candidatus Peribacteraceae bacterium]